MSVLDNMTEEQLLAIINEGQILTKENKRLRAGASEFSKALQDIGLKLVQMGIEIRLSLPETKNDGQKQRC